jgi:hypothetical protein
MAALKAQADFFQNQITMLNERIRELEAIAAGRQGQAE